MNACPGPQELYIIVNIIIIMDMNPTRRYTVSCIPWPPHSNRLETAIYNRIFNKDTNSNTADLISFAGEILILHTIDSHS